MEIRIYASYTWVLMLDEVDEQQVWHFKVCEGRLETRISLGLVVQPLDQCLQGGGGNMRTRWSERLPIERVTCSVGPPYPC